VICDLLRIGVYSDSSFCISVSIAIVQAVSFRNRLRHQNWKKSCRNWMMLRTRILWMMWLQVC